MISVCGASVPFCVTCLKSKSCLSLEMSMASTSSLLCALQYVAATHKFIVIDSVQITGTLLEDRSDACSKLTTKQTLHWTFPPTSTLLTTSWFVSILRAKSRFWIVNSGSRLDGTSVHACELSLLDIGDFHCLFLCLVRAMWPDSTLTIQPCRRKLFGKSKSELVEVKSETLFQACADGAGQRVGGYSSTSLQISLDL
jgi:hypothetical protein